MRTMITVGKTHEGKWQLIGDPDLSMVEQKKAFRMMSKDGKSHPKFCKVVQQESDGHAFIKHFTHPTAQAKIDEVRKKEMEAHVAAGKLEETEKEQRIKEAALARDKQHGDEIDRLNKMAEDVKTRDKERDDAAKKQVEELRNVKHPPGPNVNAEGLRTDGPSIEAWTDNGMSELSYPPPGFTGWRQADVDLIIEADKKAKEEAEKQSATGAEGGQPS